MTTARDSRCGPSLARAFTLLEIIVVVTIIALLATLIVPRLLSRVDQAKVAVAKTGVNTIAHQVDLYCLDHDLSAPGEGFELTVLTEGEHASLKPAALTDPWKNDYVLFVPGQTDPAFNVASYGSDGQPGGEGYATDILNQ